MLNEFDLSVFQGKTVALVGPSGCGKSTVMQLLLRFYTPDSGEIAIDEQNLHLLDLSTLRSYLGVVSQEPNLFDRTIGDNIAYGANHKNVSKEEIVEAAVNANIHTFVTSLPLVSRYIYFKSSITHRAKTK